MKKTIDDLIWKIKRFFGDKTIRTLSRKEAMNIILKTLKK